MPYLPFPSTWPVYTPAKKLANWLESYASILELSVWLSANATKVYRPDSGEGWRVDIDVKGEKKTVKTKHVVFAIGWGAGHPRIPEYPGTVRNMLP
jgi:cation diffusion facilitator CzcD-associated flavoprotein CzcO